MSSRPGILQGNEMDDEEISAFLTGQGVGVLSMSNEGTPYGIPLSFRYDGGLRSTMAASPADDETLRKAYRDTLEIALEALESRLDAFDGRTVITADHGEVLGERLAPIPVRWYGHPGGIYVPELVEVPWHVVSAGPRRHTTADPPVGVADADDEDVTESLRALGYLQ